MEENKITAITKEKTDVLKEAYKDTLEILDAYDHSNTDSSGRNIL